ncbi:MAG: hypothetical protein Q7R40_20180 [Phaeospirillum sp.]|nr:hypothetical protein [Phaeospirillum sp.]
MAEHDDYSAVTPEEMTEIKAQLVRYLIEAAGRSPGVGALARTEIEAAMAAVFDNRAGAQLEAVKRSAELTSKFGEQTAKASKNAEALGAQISEAVASLLAASQADSSAIRKIEAATASIVRSQTEVKTAVSDQANGLAISSENAKNEVLNYIHQNFTATIPALQEVIRTEIRSNIPSDSGQTVLQHDILDIKADLWELRETAKLIEDAIRRADEQTRYRDDPPRDDYFPAPVAPPRRHAFLAYRWHAATAVAAFAFAGLVFFAINSIFPALSQKTKTAAQIETTGVTATKKEKPEAQTQGGGIRVEGDVRHDLNQTSEGQVFGSSATQRRIQDADVSTTNVATGEHVVKDADGELRVARTAYVQRLSLDERLLVLQHFTKGFVFEAAEKAGSCPSAILNGQPLAVSTDGKFGPGIIAAAKALVSCTGSDKDRKTNLLKQLDKHQKQLNERQIISTEEKAQVVDHLLAYIGLTQTTVKP